jgi:cell division inhibitor SepF
MGRLQKAMSFLGLADEDYDDFEPYEEPIPSGPVRVGRTADPDPSVGGIRPMGTRDEGVTPIPTGIVPRPVVRPVSAPKGVAKVHLVVVTEFNRGAEEIGTHVRDGEIVVANLQSVDPELARRLIDFMSGLTFGLRHSMERAANKVFLLRPTDVEMPPEEEARLKERGLYS